MSLFGTGFYHIQLRLAALHVIYKYETFFRELVNAANILEIFDQIDRPIDHFQKLIKQVGALGEYGDEIVMLAISNGLYKFCIAYANEKLLAIEPIIITLENHSEVALCFDGFMFMFVLILFID
jgi:hypothetical protein